MEYAIEFVKVKDIKPYKKNAKKHPPEQRQWQHMRLDIGWERLQLKELKSVKKRLWPEPVKRLALKQKIWQGI